MRTGIDHAELSGKLGRLMGMLQTDPANGSLRRQCIDIAASLGKFDLVTSLAESALAADAADAGARFDLATGLIGSRDYRAALAVLEKVEHAVGKSAAVQLNKALCHYCLGEYEHARPLLEACYASGARDAGLVRLLVSTCHHLGALDEAAKVADENAQLALTDAALAGVYALVYLDADNAPLAARWAKATLEMNPKSTDGRVVQGSLFAEQMEVDSARQMFEAVIVDAPGAGRAWLGLGALSLLAGDMVSAREQIARGLESMPQHVGSWHMLAWAHLMSGDLAAAQNAFEKALAVDTGYAETYGGLGTIAAMRADKGNAERFIGIALQLDPQCLSAQFAQAILLGNADPARAQNMIRTFVSGLSPQAGGALNQLLGKLTRH